jgi:hopanoid biosynthesis associated RND transporter like protein HpnN
MKTFDRRTRLMGALAGLVCRRPRTVLLLATILSAASVFLASTRLGFQPDRNALISESLPWNRLFLDWRSSFPGQTDFYVVVDAGPLDAPDSAQRVVRAQALIRELGPALARDPHVERVVWSYPVSGFSPRTLRMEDWPAFEARLRDLADAAPLLASDTPEQLLAHAAQVAAGPGEDKLDEARAAALLRSFSGLLDALGRTLAKPVGERPALGDLLDPPGPGDRFITTNGRLFFIRVTPRVDAGSLDMFGLPIASIREQLAAALARHPGVEAGLTGIDVIESDETTVAQRDATLTSIGAAVVIAGVLVFAFRSVRTPVILMIALLHGVAWSFGFATLAVGHLQVVSIVFTAMLLGLGIDFGTYQATVFERLRHHEPDDGDGCTQAMVRSLQAVGPGLVTGALTTSLAFGTTVFTDFRGVAEMGLIAGVGVMLCLVSMFSVYPALVRLYKPRLHHVARAAEHRFDVYKEAWSLPTARHPRATVAVAAILSLISLTLATQARFDFDLLKVFPENLESLRWQRRVAKDGGAEVWTATVIARDLDHARQLKQLIEDRAGEIVSWVGGIGVLMPSDDDRKVAALNALRPGLVPAAERALTKAKPAPPWLDLDTQLALLTGPLNAAAQAPDTPAALRPLLAEASNRAAAARATLGSFTPELRRERLAILRAEYAQFRRRTAQQISSLLDTSPLTPADVPADLLHSYLERGGQRVALEVSPRVPPTATSALDPVFLPRFVKALEALAPGVTGVMVQVYRSGDLIRSSYVWAGLWAFLIVTVAVYMDFRRWSDVLLSLTPVACGFINTFGLMMLAGVQVNPANIIVLPLMFGIGVDTGVHVVHRFHRSPGEHPLGLTHGTGKGLTLAAGTTMIGFGSMLFAEHRGIADLAFVMTAGIGLTLLCAWFVMPALLTWRRAAGRSRA